VGLASVAAGLYAIGGGQFVSYGGYNPNQTIQALAYFSAEHLLKKLGVDGADMGLLRAS